MKKWLSNPWLVLLMLVVNIFLAESLVMSFLGEFSGFGYPYKLIYIDSILLVFLLCPPLYFLVVNPLITQIKERYAAENALKSSTAKYVQLIDSVEGIVWEADPDTFSFKYVSRRAEDLLGYPVCDWLDNSTFWVDHLHPEDREWAVDFCVSATREKRDHIFEYRMIAADGRIVWLRDIVTVIMEHGELASLRGLMVDVTDRKAAELGLIASEKRLKFLTDNLHDVIWEVDRDLCCTYVSGSVLEMLSYCPEELLGKPFDIFMAETSVKKLHELVDTNESRDQIAPSANVTVSHEFEFLKKDGSVLCAEVCATVIYSSSGQLDRIVGSSRDVSERKLVEAELNAAHDLLEKTINNLNEAVVVVDDCSGAVRDCNRATEQMFGYSREELLGEQMAILHVSDELHEYFINNMHERINEAGSYATKFRMKRKNGSLFSSELSVSPIGIEGGNHLHYVCVIKDISAQILHEQELDRAYNLVAERNAFVESVISSIQSGIVVLDPDFFISMINPYAADICKRQSDELVGMSFKEVCPELYEKVVAGCEPSEIMATFLGTSFVIGFASTPVKSKYNSVAGTIVTFKDLAEVIKIRNEIRLKQRLSAMGEVVARVAHEMRNPLFGMTAAVQILNMELTLNEAQQVLMDSFLKESKRLNNLVEELLSSTREIRLNRREVNLVDVVNDSLRLVSEIAAERGVSLTSSDVGGEIKIHADHDKLEQVLLNLLKNGIEACNEGGMVELSVSVDANYAKVLVMDTGCGIPMESFDSIFDVFYTTKKNGTGMGLSISKNIVEAHGGELLAYNCAEQGATFVMTIPMEAPSN